MADHPVVGEMGEQGPGGRCGLVGAAVVDDQHLGPADVHGPVVHGGVEALDALGQPVGLVEGGNDDGELECHGPRGSDPRRRRRRWVVAGAHGPTGRAAPTKPSDQTGSKVTTVPVWAAWMMVPLP